MLQRNNSHHAHIAHAAVVGMHALCCGLPALAMLAAALSGAASVGSLLPESFEQFHRLLHGYELWIVCLSAALVALGGWLEASARRHHPDQRFPWLFAFSVLCFLINVGVIAAHRA
ncbi:MAG TPA: hypothetical protein VEF55_01285 [Candidatus Binatia bacterium]|nr:hypothetical protein [Candidatus Binatia bacterium]